MNLLASSSVSNDQKLDPKLLELMPQIKNNGKYWPETTKFLVIVHQYDGDVKWAERLKFPHIIYEKNKPEKEPFNAINKAKAETNLLKFIAEFYDDLPENIIQVYQYEYKHYHPGSLVDILNAADFETKYAQSKSRGFWNFNHMIWTEGPDHKRMLESGWWSNTMAPWFGDIYSYGDFITGKMGCAQFVVSRERIRSLPREFYVNMYFWLVRNTIDQLNVGFDPHLKTRLPTPIDYHCNSNYHTSRYMEWSWELSFTSHKPHESITVPVNLNTSEAKESPKRQIKLTALYGAKKYYRDVTNIVISYFLQDDKIVIPASIDLNRFFSDVVYGSLKTLIITI
jgi:hypothetical protein